MSYRPPFFGGVASDKVCHPKPPETTKPNSFKRLHRDRNVTDYAKYAQF
jgi:hypothetical protein